MNTSPPNNRPDPDELLARVQAEEKQRVGGRLKIFFGYAAGVGKTYAMLEAAHQRKAEGVDVVVGLCRNTQARGNREYAQGFGGHPIQDYHLSEYSAHRNGY